MNSGCERCRTAEHLCLPERLCLELDQRILDPVIHCLLMMNGRILLLTETEVKKQELGLQCFHLKEKKEEERNSRRQKIEM